MSKVTDWILFEEAQWLKNRIWQGCFENFSYCDLKKQIANLKSKWRGLGSNSGPLLHC